MKKAMFFVIMIAVSMFMMPTAKAIDLEVANVDGVKYATVQEAINNANGKTVLLFT